MGQWSKRGDMIEYEPAGGGICASRWRRPAVMPEIQSRAPTPLAMSHCSRHASLTGKVRAVFSCILWIALARSSPGQIISAPYSKTSSTFTLNGAVLNSVTGEPISRALVRISGLVQRTAFTDAEGRFEIDGLPAGPVDVELQKPGYYRQQDARMNLSLIHI